MSEKVKGIDGLLSGFQLLSAPRFFMSAYGLFFNKMALTNNIRANKTKKAPAHCGGFFY